MKTSLISLWICLVALAIDTSAQVKIEDSKSTLSGKNDLLLTPIQVALLDHFTINFYNYQYASDNAGNNAKGNANSVAVEAMLKNLDNQTLQEITDQAYDYYTAEWLKRGFTVKCPSAAEIEASKPFTKDKNKGKAEVRIGGAYPEDQKVTKYTTFLPSNTAQARKEAYGSFSYGNNQFFPTDFKSDVASVNFHLDLNFINFTSGFGSQASVKGMAELTSTSGGSLVIWAKTKFLTAGYYNKGTGGSDFYDAFDKGTPWVITANPEKYKTLALEIIKRSIDSQFAEYDANVAKEKK